MGFEIREVVNWIDRLIDAKVAAASAANGDEQQKADRLAAVKRAKVDLERALEKAQPKTKVMNF